MELKVQRVVIGGLNQKFLDGLKLSGCFMKTSRTILSPALGFLTFRVSRFNVFSEIVCADL